MRVKIGNRIYLCTVVTRPKESKLLLFTISNAVYTVDMETPENAEICHNNILTTGYLNVSAYSQVSITEDI